MRPDQEQRLDDLSEKVMDAFLDAADTDLWAGAGQEPAAMDPAIRGARNWDAKNANQMGSLVMRVLDLRDRLKEAAPVGGEKPDDEAQNDIAKYEREASRLLEKVQSGALKHGRPR